MAVATDASRAKPRKRAKPDTIPAHDLMIVAALRYCLGRRSYIVRDCVDWLDAHWDAIPERTRAIIQRDIDEEFWRDNEARASEHGWRPLGDDCDRAQWARLRRKWCEPHCCQCGKPCPSDAAAVVHGDGEVSCKDCHSDTCIVCGKGFKLSEGIIPVGRKALHPGCAAGGAGGE